MKIYIAPVQGHTDPAWRYFHHKIYGGNYKYFTPFMRLEHGELRSKDLRDFRNPLNEAVNLEPQVIFRDIRELDILLSPLINAGAKAINLNMGCPFPLQTAKGRGAAFLANRQEAEKLPDLIAKYSDTKFSVKMRLGMDDPDQWKGIIEVLNNLELENIYVHPRIARQKYTGDLYLDSFMEFIERSDNSVVFNGDIKTPDDIRTITGTFSTIKGIMTARGVLGRPSLPTEYEEGEWTYKKRIKKMLEFHDEIFRFYKENLCGDSQILAKIKPFWEYSEPEIGRKAWKAIRKATKIEKYNQAVSLIQNL